MSEKEKCGLESGVTDFEAAESSEHFLVEKSLLCSISPRLLIRRLYNSIRQINGNMRRSPEQVGRITSLIIKQTSAFFTRIWSVLNLSMLKVPLEKSPLNYKSLGKIRNTWKYVVVLRTSQENHFTDHQRNKFFFFQGFGVCLTQPCSKLHLKKSSRTTNLWEKNSERNGNMRRSPEQVGRITSLIIKQTSAFFLGIWSVLNQSMLKVPLEKSTLELQYYKSFEKKIRNKWK